MKFSNRAVFACSICIAITAGFAAAAPKDKPAAGKSAFDAISALSGTWVAVGAPEGQKPMSLVFKSTAGGSAILETMFPGSDHEMVNVYSIDGEGVLLTHYCHLGNQ